MRLPTRPSRVGVICRSCTGGASFRSLAAEAPLTSIGPQSWSGDRLSYGSATETRYGNVLAERRERRGGATARGRRVDRVCDLPVPEDDLALRGGDSRICARGLVGDAAVHLAAPVGEQVERLALLQVEERVRARGDGLRLERRLGPRLRHLGGDDTLEVRLEADGVDDLQRLAVGDDRELAAVRAAVHEQRGARTRRSAGSCAARRRRRDRRAA